LCFEPADAAAKNQQGREHTAGRSGGERNDPDDRLHKQDGHDDLEDDVITQEVADDVVAHAESAGLDQAAQSDRNAANRWPPHPVQWKPEEQILGLVKQAGQQAGLQSRNDTDADAGEGSPPWQVEVSGKGKERAGADQQRSQRGSNDAGANHGDQAARLPFEQQQLNREQHGGDWRAEYRRHAGGTARNQQRLALRGAQAEALRE
jgi:hypothetical protein